MSEPTKCKPESQNIKECSELRQECRNSIFEKIEDHQKILLNELGEIKKDLAYKEGYEEATAQNIVINSNNEKNTAEKINWKATVLKMLIIWGGPILFLMILGLIALLKSKGLL